LVDYLLYNLSFSFQTFCPLHGILEHLPFGPRALLEALLWPVDSPWWSLHPIRCTVNHQVRILICSHFWNVPFLHEMLLFWGCGPQRLQILLVVIAPGAIGVSTKYLLKPMANYSFMDQKLFSLL
jgi:hypothetical protein